MTNACTKDDGAQRQMTTPTEHSSTISDQGDGPSALIRRLCERAWQLLPNIIERLRMEGQ